MDFTTLTFLLALAICIIALIITLMRKSSRQRIPQNEQIYIGNLAYHVDEYDLKGYFSKFGAIRYTKIVKNLRTGRSKGFAFITYANAKEAAKALAAHGNDLQGRSLVVRIAKPRPSDFVGA